MRNFTYTILQLLEKFITNSKSIDSIINYNLNNSIYYIDLENFYNKLKDEKIRNDITKDDKIYI